MSDATTTTTHKGDPAPALFQPVDLIVAQVMFRMADEAQRYELARGRPPSPAQLQDETARQVLLAIAKHASLDDVFAACAALGAPGSPDECTGRLRATVERSTRKRSAR